MQIGNGEKCKTLGLAWSAGHDALTYSIENWLQDTHITKRIVLSHTSQIFYPLGLVSPCTVIAKVMLKKLWMEKVTWDEVVPDSIAHTWEKLKKELEKVTWDEVVPDSIAHTWEKLKKELVNLNSINILRRVTCNDFTRIELHGFADASESAYGACIHVRSIDCEGNVRVNLLCAKSKVAPVKSQTMPRLELCGALTLSRLLEKRFQNVTSKSDWRHVPSKHNAADILSRGMCPNNLQECHLWWHGPTFLLEEPSRWPNTQFDIPGLPEMKEPTRALLSFEKSEKFPFDRFPTLTKLKRTVAFMLRFKTNCFKQKFKRNVDGLTAEEVNTAYLCLIRLSQREMFPNEYLALYRAAFENRPPPSVPAIHKIVNKCGTDGALIHAMVNDTVLSQKNKRHRSVLSQKNKRHR
ncbi:Pao retrotransposon peptidase [Popillia japonica]|uniref:Pao retrotransposon peptidase n=1 Tax=Popillia japonica TaxID=7064 RepID=A0AAW1L1J5_POPJA